MSTASASAVMADALCVNSITRRRSHASATAPPVIENRITGSNRTRPTMPSAMARRCGDTSSDTCHRMAATCIIDPENEISCPVQSRR